jgi:hypothetical protein
MATASMPAPEAQSQPAISPIGRIVGVFFSPKATFEDIARKPSWAAPIILLTLIGLAMNIFLVNKADWRAFSEEQLMNSPRGQ